MQFNNDPEDNPNDPETAALSKEMWGKLISIKEELAELYDTLKEGYNSMDDVDSILAMPKSTLNTIMFVYSAAMAELCRREKIELARIRDSN